MADGARSPLLGSPRFRAAPAPALRAAGVASPAPLADIAPAPRGAGASPVMARPPAGGELRIGALNLSMPGTGAAQGRRVAERVTEILARRCPEALRGGAGREIARIGLQIRARSGGDEALSESIADAVIEAMRKG